MEELKKMTRDELVKRFENGERDFSHIELEKNADLSEMEWQEADFSGSKMQGVNFRNADVQGALFIDSNLQSADFRGAHVDCAAFVGASLVDAKINIDKAILLLRAMGINLVKDKNDDKPINWWKNRVMVTVLAR